MSVLRDLMYTPRNTMPLGRIWAFPATLYTRVICLVWWALDSKGVTFWILTPLWSLLTGQAKYNTFHASLDMSFGPVVEELQDARTSLKRTTIYCQKQEESACKSLPILQNVHGEWSLRTTRCTWFATIPSSSWQHSPICERSNS